MKKDYTAWIVGAAVLGAFILLICAWVFFFWIAANNRVADVPLEALGAQQTERAGSSPPPVVDTYEQGQPVAPAAAVTKEQPAQ